MLHIPQFSCKFHVVIHKSYYTFKDLENIKFE